MSSVRTLHDEAMNLAEEALLARRAGDEEAQLRLHRKAYELERQAAELVVFRSGPEPTRSVMLRSAASLAMNCGEHRQAERLIATALAGDPPEEIAGELRNLLRQLYAEWRSLGTG